jgi:hypothetical protein
MNRRNFTAAALTAPLLTACIYGQYFDIEWDEEVLLHDGRVIVVHVKHTYERLQNGFTRYGGKIIHRDSMLSFDAGGTTGRVTQLFKAGAPLLIDQVDGIWYIAFYWNQRWHRDLLGGQNWGGSTNGLGQYVATVQGKQLVPISICALPAVARKPNLRFRRDEVGDLAKFDGKLMTLHDKRGADQIPSSPAEVSIQMPSTRSTLACKPINELTEGEKS